MIESRFGEYRKLTNEPVSAAVLVLASLLCQRQERGYFTPRDVADRLGVSERTVHAMCADGRLPHTKVGRQYRISEADLAEFANAERTVSGFIERHL